MHLWETIKTRQHRLVVDFLIWRLEGFVEFTEQEKKQNSVILRASEATSEIC